MAEKKEIKKEDKKKESRFKMPKIRKEKTAKQEVKKEEIIVEDPYNTLQYVLMTEKSVRMIESQNKLVFIVRRNSGKQEIRNAAQSAFKSNITNVTTTIDQKGRKKAFVKFEKPGEAGEIAIRLGII